MTSLELDEIVAEARNKDTGSADEGVIYALKGSLRLIYSIAMCGRVLFARAGCLIAIKSHQQLRNL